MASGRRRAGSQLPRKASKQGRSAALAGSVESMTHPMNYHPRSLLHFEAKAAWLDLALTDIHIHLDVENVLEADILSVNVLAVDPAHVVVVYWAQPNR